MTPGTRYLRHLTRIFCGSLSKTQSLDNTARRFNVSPHVVKQCLIQAERIGLLDSTYVSKAITNRAAFRRVLGKLLKSEGREQLKRPSRRGYTLIDVSAEQAVKLNAAHKLYEELKSYQAVADELGVTRERVRQLLARGAAAGLFKHELTSDRRRQLLEQELGRAELARAVTESSCHNIARRYHVGPDAIVELCEKYGLETRELRRERTRRETIAEYRKMVDELGHHPSTAEMNRAGYRALWSRISRLWGSFERFRKAFGIQFVKRPNTWLHPMSPAENKARSERLREILNVIDQHPGIGVMEVASKVGAPYGIVAYQVHQQVKLGVLRHMPRKRIGDSAQLYLTRKEGIAAVVTEISINNGYYRHDNSDAKMQARSRC